MNIDALEQIIRHEYHKSYLKIIKSSSDDRSTLQNTKLRHFRVLFEQYIFNYLILTYGVFLDLCWLEYTPPLKSDKAIVIVERRCHPNFWFILRNLAWAAPNMSVYIFCSDNNANYIRGLLGDKVDNFNVFVVFKGDDVPEKMAISEYNNLLTDPKFYEHIDAEWMLTIQMDCFIRRKITDSLFIGAYWGYPFGWRPEYAGGGGATIRNVKKMYELCKTCDRKDIFENNMAEDVWFSEKMLEMKEIIPSFEFRRDHIMENVPSNNPYVVHQFWTYIDSYANLINTSDFKKYLEKLLRFEVD
jgi:hypothetical protein